MRIKPAYKLSDLVDVGKLHSIMATFYRLTGIGSSIIDLDGNIIVGDYATGWKCICMEFHRKHPETLKKCIESDSSLCNKLLSGEKYVLYNCLNGMVDSAVPIMIRGEHIANLFSGQYFTSPPDKAFFRAQADRYGFDEEEYLSALNEVAVLPVERVKEGTQFLTDLAEMIGRMALSNREIIEINEQLENRVEERTRELVKSNQMLQAEIFDRKRTEKALSMANADAAEERQRLIDVLETLPSYVVLLTADYHVSFANRVFRERFGEDRGRRCYEYLFNRNEPCETCETYTVLKTGAPHHWEWLGPDGRNYDIFDYPFTERDGSPCIVETGIDITERKRAEGAVQTERKRLFDVLETLPAMICLLTPDYHVPFANRSFREKFGESKGRRCYEYCFGRTEPCEFCESYNVLKTGQPHHWEVPGPDGSVIDAHDFPFTDADGSPLILEMDIDITERKRAEVELRSASLYARSLIEASLDPLVTISAGGKITDVNDATIKATGVPREQLIGTDFSDYVTEPGKARDAYELAFFKGFVTDYPLTIRNKDGRLTQVLYNATVYRDAQGNIRGVFAAARDVTAQKEAEAKIAEQRSREEQQARELERLADLERFHKITVGRELRMIELKHEIDALKREVETLKNRAA